MRGRTNAAAAGGGAEPVYGVLPASAISVADAGYEKTITVTFPQPIKKLYGLRMTGWQIGSCKLVMSKKSKHMDALFLLMMKTSGMESVRLSYIEVCTLNSVRIQD